MTVRFQVRGTEQSIVLQAPSPLVSPSPPNLSGSAPKPGVSLVIPTSASGGGGKKSGMGGAGGGGKGSQGLKSSVRSGH